MTKRFVTALSATAAVVGALLPMTSDAMPVFARQTGKTCLTCHFQNFPILNAYGQEFKAGGYTDMGGKLPEIKGPDLSLPGVLNSTLIGKFRYVTTNETPSTVEHNIPDEFSLLMGGRAAANVGFMVEASLVSGTTQALAGFKMPVTVYKTDGGTRFGVVPFATGGIGAGFGFELLNTGAVANVRVFEHGFATSAQQFVVGEYAAWGLSATASNADFFANFSRWTPNYGYGNSGAPTANYLRAAWTGSLMGFESGAGVQMSSGTFADATNVTQDAKFTALDFQAQGSVAGMPLGIWASWASAPKTDVAGGGKTNYFNAGAVDKSALAVSAQLGLFSHAAVKAGFVSGSTDDGTGQAAADNAVTLGVNYHLAQNLGLVAEHTHFTRNNGAISCAAAGCGGKNNGGSARTTLMLETAF